MEFDKSDLINLENVIRMIKIQKYNDIGWEQILIFSRALGWLDKFHDKVLDEVKQKESMSQTVPNAAVKPPIPVPMADLSYKSKSKLKKKE